MTVAGFRRIALALADATEGAHMGHPDFRVRNRIFATIHSDARYGMVKLTPEQQEHFIRQHPHTFAPESGAWGRSGCTRVTFDALDEETVGEAMTLAWQNTLERNAGARPNGTTRRPTQRSQRLLKQKR